MTRAWPRRHATRATLEEGFRSSRVWNAFGHFFHDELVDAILYIRPVDTEENDPAARSLPWPSASGINVSNEERYDHIGRLNTRTFALKR
jgi:hypothetical protein